MEQRSQGREKKATVNATVRLEPEDWEALEDKAKEMGMASRTELLRQIARGYIETRKALTSQERQILGKS
ncbi:plasmid mobilization protein [Microcoleus sp. D3_18a_C4]|uniref:plasmid mobilization protein n=1 Tax=Microcoleus sp. D3_18a_C4 TaxID=3055332 RepID=UPI00403F8CEE